MAGAGNDLKIRRDPKTGTYVQGLSERELTDAEGLTKMIDDGNKKRAVAATLMNAESSRSHFLDVKTGGIPRSRSLMIGSHAVVIIRLEQEHPANLARGQPKKKVASKINLVDLLPLGDFGIPMCSPMAAATGRPRWL